MTTLTPTRTTMTVAEGIAHYASHTPIDRGIVRATVEAAGAVSAYTVPSGSYVAYVNAANEVVTYVHHGYLTVTEQAARMPKQDPSTGRHSVSTAASYMPNAWDLYLSGWEGPAPHEAGGTRVPGGRPKVATPTRQTCLEEDCKIWVPGGGMCGKHQRALDAMLAAL